MEKSNLSCILKRLNSYCLEVTVITIISPVPQQMPWRLPKACRVWSPDVLASLPICDFTSSAYKSLEELLFNPFCHLRELESRSSDPFLLKELRSLIFTFVPASKVLTQVLKSRPFDSLQGEMLAPFAWFCCIFCLPFFSLVLLGALVVEVMWNKHCDSEEFLLLFWLYVHINPCPLKSSKMHTAKF